MDILYAPIARLAGNTKGRGPAPLHDAARLALSEYSLRTGLRTNDDERGRTCRYEERRHSEVFAV
jgi:hypothetical protein